MSISASSSDSQYRKATSTDNSSLRTVTSDSTNRGEKSTHLEEGEEPIGEEQPKEISVGTRCLGAPMWAWGLMLTGTFFLLIVASLAILVTEDKAIQSRPPGPAPESPKEPYVVIGVEAIFSVLKELSETEGILVEGALADTFGEVQGFVDLAISQNRREKAPPGTGFDRVEYIHKKTVFYTDNFEGDEKLWTLYVRASGPHGMMRCIERTLEELGRSDGERCRKFDLFIENQKAGAVHFAQPSISLRAADGWDYDDSYSDIGNMSLGALRQAIPGAGCGCCRDSFCPEEISGKAAQVR